MKWGCGHHATPILVCRTPRDIAPRNANRAPGETESFHNSHKAHLPTQTILHCTMTAISISLRQKKVVYDNLHFSYFDAIYCF